MSAVSTSQQWYNDVSSLEFGAWCKRMPQVKAAGQTRRKISFRSSAHIQMDIDQISFRRRAHIQMYMDRISFRLIAHIQMHMDQISFRRRAHMWMEKYPSPPLFPIPPPPPPPKKNAPTSAVRQNWTRNQGLLILNNSKKVFVITVNEVTNPLDVMCMQY